MVSSLTCPNCKAGVESLWGHEDPNVYDGVLYWSCGVCTWAWSRDWSSHDLRRYAAENAVELHNQIRQRMIEQVGIPGGEPQDDDRGE